MHTPSTSTALPLPEGAAGPTPGDGATDPAADHAPSGLPPAAGSECRTDGPSPTALPVAAVRDALRSAGTAVWEWDLQSDALAGFDDSIALLGYAPGELGGTQKAWDRVIHPEDLAANHHAYLCHARGESPSYESEYRARARDGSWHWMSERGQILDRTPEGAPRRMVGTLSRIDHRKRIEHTAHELLGRLQLIARSAPGVLFQYLAKARSGDFLYVSERSAELLGVPAHALMDDSGHWRRLILPEDRERIAGDIARAVASAEPWTTEYRIRHPRTGVRLLRATSTVQPQPDGSSLWHGYLEDVTDERQMEQVREEAAAARAANAAKTEFLARMSHELRTPLNAVLGFSQLMEMDSREPLTAEQRRRVGYIREAGAHLLRMIGDLLDLTRIEAGQMDVALVPTALTPLLHECLDMLRPQAEAAGVRLMPLDAVPAQTQVMADPTRLRQVLLNLLSNAVKYNRRGGSVRLTLAAAPDAVKLYVADTGMGMAPADVDRLFEPFNRLAQRHSAIEGTGIGLAVTKRLVELMAGHIAASSALGVGSTFVVTLPSPPDPADSADPGPGN